MIIRSKVELLLNLGNYQNVKCIGEVSLDTEVANDLASAEHVAGQLGIELTDATSPLQLAKVVRAMALKDVEEQKAALDEADTSLFKI